MLNSGYTHNICKKEKKIKPNKHGFLAKRDGVCLLHKHPSFFCFVLF